MSVTVKMQVRCNKPGCYAKFSYFGRILSVEDMRVPAAEGWQLPKAGDLSTAPTYCPRHRRYRK